MIGDIYTVMWKEIKEIVIRQGTTLGGLLRFAWAFGLLGIYFPLTMGRSFLDGPTFLLLYIGIPIFFGIVIMPDLFAGERERHTLETLLASRLSDLAILFGKLLVGMLYCFIMTLLFIFLSLVVINVAYWNGQLQMYPPSLLAFVLAIAVLFDTLFAAIGVLISLRAPTVRQGAETMMIVLFALAAIPIALYLILPNDLKNGLLDWLTTTDAGVVGLAALTVLAVACLVALYAAMLNFRRSKLVLE
jgi:ABC-2 type transport system permease protein